MSCFRLSDSFLRELESSMADFFWNYGTESKIHLNAWSKLCLPKAKGGLNFCRLKEYNLALLAKQAWRVSMGLWGVLHAILNQKYFLGATLFEVRLGSSPSYPWRSIWDIQDLFAAIIRWQLIARPVSLRGDLTMPSVIMAYKKWNEALIQTEFRFADANCIFGIPLRGTDGKDALIWHFEKNGRFTVKSAYRLVCDMGAGGNCSQLGRSWKFIWSSKAPPKVALFAWRCAWEALPTTVNLQRRGIAVNEGCGGYTMEKEEVMHVLFYCSFARLVWQFSVYLGRLCLAILHVQRSGSEVFLVSWTGQIGISSLVFAGLCGE
ncbi:UNVERIFIED_CONTAM: hypothetical protein Slati_1475400 [Sesamum latifolium]|uniref:Reverse transcriptase zinc-binding domain-containing protein n=1 Tax=Sesamum latifolium TaxID=2727402 RepID=A0AAW2XAL0_9LAMI